MFGLGYSANVQFSLGAVPATAAQFFSPSEQAFMEGLFAQTSEERIQQKQDGLSDTIESLRLSDGVNAKMALHSVRKLQNALDEIAAALDIEFSDGAPHTPLYGPKFPRDVREIPIQGKILAVNGLKLTDHQALFGDAYWESVEPDERLQDHEIEMLTGAAAGETRQITGHVIKGTGAPYIVVDDATNIAAGNRFRVKDAVIPQDNLDKRDRSRDWVVTTAIRGRLTSAAAGQVFANVFGNAYWSSAKKTLKGRKLIVLDGDFAGEHLILTHNVGGGFITLEGAPALLGNEDFAIVPLSPLANGTQNRGTLRRGDPADGRRYDTLEPGTRRRLHPWNLGRLDGETKVSVETEMERIDRYLHMRYHRWFGSYRRLRRTRKTAKRIQKQFEQEALMHDDIREAVEDLDLFVDIDEPEVALEEDLNVDA